MQRPNADETEEDILKLQEEFAAQPPAQRAAQVVNANNPANRSQFAQNRGIPVAATDDNDRLDQFREMREALGDIGEHGHIEMDVAADRQLQNVEGVVVGNVVENMFDAPKEEEAAVADDSAQPAVARVPIERPSTTGRSLFALSMAAGCNAGAPIDAMELGETDEELLGAVGGANKPAAPKPAEPKPAEPKRFKIHNEIMDFKKAEAHLELYQRRRNSVAKLDPSAIKMLMERNQATPKNPYPGSFPDSYRDVYPSPAAAHALPTPNPLLDLPMGNVAIDLLSMAKEEKWLHFDMVETDKLHWLSDIPQATAQPNDKYEARFNWRGLLMPYTLDENSYSVHDGHIDKRDLYLHGDEPHRPGYTLQELFRFARSNVQQQRVAAYEAIAGILNFYNQGVYDNVLELPLAKIFFLSRIGCDETSVPLVEASLNTMAKLLYNDADEYLIDFMYENPGCYVQPSFNKCDDSVEPLILAALLKSDVDNDTMNIRNDFDDFGLAEHDLVECALHSNLIARISYLLKDSRYDNAVPSCLKILIRLARKSEQAVNFFLNNDLMTTLFERFMLPFAVVDTERRFPRNYSFPQYLCLKLLRILMAQSEQATQLIVEQNIVNVLRGFFYTTDNLHSNSIMVQIEAIRVLHTMCLRNVNFNYNTFLPAINYMLLHHYQKLDYQTGGPYLLRQHATALLSVLTALIVKYQLMDATLNHTLSCCCTKWLCQATDAPADVSFKEFSQINLLTVVMNTIAILGMSLYSADSRTFARNLNKFLESEVFLKFVRNIGNSSVLLRTVNNDRHMYQPSLPNAGAVSVGENGPELVLPQAYPVPLLLAVFQVMERFQGMYGVHLTVKFAIGLGETILGNYLCAFIDAKNDVLCRNFFAKTEMRFIFYLLSTKMWYAMPAERLVQLAYKLVSVGTADFIGEIRHSLEHMIFNSAVIQMNPNMLSEWAHYYLDMIPEFDEKQLSALVLPSHGRTLLPTDWPYMFLLKMYQGFLQNEASALPDEKIIKMTCMLTMGLDEMCSKQVTTTPEQKLMYLMIAFMSENTDFLSPDVNAVLAMALDKFYRAHATYVFNFDTARVGEYKFENMYYLFLDHYQAVSYGDPLFGSLVMVPLAQRHPKKWRLRVWSEMVNIFTILDCEEYLLGGLEAYLTPKETDMSMRIAYVQAVRTLPLTSMAFKIVRAHTDDICL